MKKELNTDYQSQNVGKHNIDLRQKDKGYFIGKMATINSEYIFNQKDFKKKTKGYDPITGEISKRGKPADDQSKIFAYTPEKEKSVQDIIKDRKKKQQKKSEAQNKKLYRARLKTKWDRGW